MNQIPVETEIVGILGPRIRLIEGRRCDEGDRDFVGRNFRHRIKMIPTEHFVIQFFRHLNSSIKNVIIPSQLSILKSDCVMHYSLA